MKEGKLTGVSTAELLQKQRELNAKTRATLVELEHLYYYAEFNAWGPLDIVHFKDFCLVRGIPEHSDNGYFANRVKNLDLPRDAVGLLACTPYRKTALASHSICQKIIKALALVNLSEAWQISASAENC
ncbi:MAG: hypothetical protein GY892_24120 [Shimia sp.]|nr:hypothetical protein [Shimia sp.]